MTSYFNFLAMKLYTLYTLFLLFLLGCSQPNKPEAPLDTLGHQQSPINIPSDYQCKYAKKHLVDFHYRPSHEKIINTGHTIKIEYEPGSDVIYDSTQFNLKQFHFHTPAEHHIQGIIYPMEMHLVHQSAEGNYLVIGLMFKEGRENPTLAKILRDTPRYQGRINSDHLVNAANLLPKSRHFYTYQGSFTTPPYTEGVRWLILQEIIEASATQIHLFKQLEGENIRANQQLFDRIVERF
ncbi:MAG TPA: carbonic anhydrase [Microscillaceae bacterium]|nr:carbonic anhydrase [Microscillaceae bacterium]